MAQLFRNNAFSSLGASLTNIATTLTVTSGHGDRFPVIAAPDFMLLTLQDASNNIEVVRVTARTAASDTMTIQRAQEGTTARSWNLGDVVELRLTAFALNPLSLLEGAATASAIRSAIGAIGSTDPVTLTVNSASDALRITQTGSGNALYIEDVAADATPLVVSSTGVLGIGTTTPDNVTSAGIALVSNDGFMPQLVNRNKTVDANASYQVFDKDRAGAIVANGDVLGNIVFRGYDGAAYHQAAAIMATVDAAPGSNDMPGRLSFLTTADGANAPTERLRITNAGNVEFQNGYTEKIFAVTGTTPALSPTNGSIQTWTLSGASTPTQGTWANGQSITLLIDDGSGFTITWTSLGVIWKTNGGSAPTLLTTGLTVIQLWEVGNVIYGARVGDA